MIESHFNRRPAGSRARPAAAIRRVDHRRVHRLGCDASTCCTCWPKPCAQRRRAPDRRGREPRVRRSPRTVVVPIETELKLRIAPDAAAALARHPALRAAEARRDRARRTVTSTYYDTADGALAAAGVALRLRRDGRRWVQTVKGPADATARRRHERARRNSNGRCSGPRLDPLRFATTPFRRALGKAEQRGLAPRFTTDITRTTIPLDVSPTARWRRCASTSARCAPTTAVRVLRDADARDRARARGGRRRAAVRARASARRRRAARRSSPRARRSAATRLRQPRDAATRCAPTMPTCRASAGRATRSRAIMRVCLAQIEGNAQGVLAARRSGVDPPDAHRRAPLARVPLAGAPRHRAPSASSRCASSCAGSRRRSGRRAISTCSRRDAARVPRRRRARQRQRRSRRRCGVAGDARTARRARGARDVARGGRRLAALRAPGARGRRARGRAGGDAHAARRTSASSPRPRAIRAPAAQAPPPRAAARWAPTSRTRRRKRATPRGSPRRSCAMPPSSSRRCFRGSARALIARRSPRCRRSSAPGTTRRCAARLAAELAGRASPAAARVRRLGRGARRRAQRSARRGWQRFTKARPFWS